MPIFCRQIGMGNKNLILIHPIAPILMELKEIHMATEGTAVYEIDQLKEAAQLLPVTSPALVVLSDIKKCAWIVSTFEQEFKNTKSKCLLINTEQIDDKGLEKLKAKGLTEHILLPIPIKSLAHKVNLFLQTLA